jgi:hypothetical protein
LIDRIIELDKNQDQYIAMLNEPWFKDNQIPNYSSAAARWREIFNAVKSDE